MAAAGSVSTPVSASSVTGAVSVTAGSLRLQGSRHVRVAALSFGAAGGMASGKGS
jgi:hypothetical protein